MDFALEQARLALERGHIPVGAVVVRDGRIVGKGYNGGGTLPLPLQHAELLAMIDACANLQTDRLDGCDLIVTLEPCAMCAAAIVQMHIRHVIFGAYDPKGGGVDHGAHVFLHALHVPVVTGGVMERECAALLKTFFQSKR